MNRLRWRRASFYKLKKKAIKHYVDDRKRKPLKLNKDADEQAASQ